MLRASAGGVLVLNTAPEPALACVCVCGCDSWSGPPATLTLQAWLLRSKRRWRRCKSP